MKNSKKKNEGGFTYIEVMCAVVILMVGILAQLSAMSLSMLRQREAEKMTAARQFGNSTIESIFAARDLGNDGGISNFNTINNTNVHTDGIFVPGWTPIREDSGKDGIIGTADDACPVGADCVVGSYTNSSLLLLEYQRKIAITDITATSGTVKKKRIEVTISYFVGQAKREQTVSTIIADLPFYK
jgi:type II secretory pathway pseudopilin PulG